MKAMKAYAMCLAIGMSTTAMAGTVSNVRADAGAVRSEIFKLLKARRDAFYRGDIDKFAAFETEDFTRISEDGEFVTKAEQLAYLRERSKTLDVAKQPIAYADDELALHLVGDVAVLTGRLTETEPGTTGSPKRQQSRFTEIWVFRQGHWKTLHNHYTNIGP
jgi:ketosteroid isomerase-like protein